MIMCRVMDETRAMLPHDCQPLYLTSAWPNARKIRTASVLLLTTFAPIAERTGITVAGTAGFKAG
jgi:hypothetical protein